jgi:hypothetical protein
MKKQTSPDGVPARKVDQPKKIDTVNFKGGAKEQGDEFERECLRALLYAGFQISDLKLNIDTGAEIDLVAENLQGISFAIECKGSLQGSRPGLKRTDTVRKAICNAYLLSVSPEFCDRFPPLLVMRSHEPDGGVGRDALDATIRNGVILDVVDSRAGEKLKMYANATLEDLERILDEHKGLPIAVRSKKTPRPKTGKRSPGDSQAPLMDMGECPE